MLVLVILDGCLFFVGFIFLFTTFLALMPIQVRAASNTINFQGKILNKDDGTNLVAGSPACVAEGADTCDFRVRVYDAATVGTLLFEEEHSNIEIGDYNGIFNLSINSVCNSRGSDWTTGGCVSNGGVDFSDPSIYFEISFSPVGDANYTEVFTRKIVSQVPSAFYAERSSGTSIVDGLTPDRTLISDNSGVLTVSPVTSTELGYLDGSTVITGGLLFANGTNFLQDVTNLYWDNVNKKLAIGTNTPTDAQVHIQNDNTTSGSITMSATNGNTTFTTSSSITLYEGDYIIPKSSTYQARTISSTSTSTSFTVTDPFTGNVNAQNFAISRKTLITGARPILSLRNDFSAFTPQEWQFRVGTFHTGSSSLDVYSTSTSQTALRVENDGDIFLGTDTNFGGIGNSSRLYVYGGEQGANVDVMGEGILDKDQATIELQSSDYETSYSSVYLQYYGPQALGSTFGFNNDYLGALVFQGENTTAIIGTSNDVPLIFGTNNVERFRLDENGNIAL